MNEFSERQGSSKKQKKRKWRGGEKDPRSPEVSEVPKPGADRMLMGTKSQKMEKMYVLEEKRTVLKKNRKYTEGNHACDGGEKGRKKGWQGPRNYRGENKQHEKPSRRQGNGYGRVHTKTGKKATEGSPGGKNYLVRVANKPVKGEWGEFQIGKRIRSGCQKNRKNQIKKLICSGAQ